MPAPLTTTFLVCALALALIGESAGVGAFMGLAIGMELLTFWIVGNTAASDKEEA